MSNPFEAIALAFLKRELRSNPQLLGKFIGHMAGTVLAKHGVDPAVAARVTDDVVQAVTDLAPLIADALTHAAAPTPSAKP